MSPVEKRRDLLLLSALAFFIVIRHLLGEGSKWPEPLELFTMIELAIKVANRKP